MSEKNPTIRDTFWFFGIAVGVVLSTAVTLFMVAWEWLENPGGIFRDETGTNWQFILDTAVSWFIPTFVYASVIASIIRMIWTAIVSRRKSD